jgi:hypothetical protein
VHFFNDPLHPLVHVVGLQVDLFSIAYRLQSLGVFDGLIVSLRIGSQDIPELLEQPILLLMDREFRLLSMIGPKLEGNNLHSGSQSGTELRHRHRHSRDHWLWLVEEYSW